ncbi:MAG TPA: hypothetical protein VGQ99_03930 [Tepidisphaeraceae bacterium]|nr:hypothetical protein [Tepidisphaeraceae bacterium]
MKPRGGGIAPAIGLGVGQGLAFDIKVQPGELVAVDDGLIFGLESGRIGLGDGQLCPGRAAEGDQNVTPAFADRLDLIGVQILLHGDPPEPGRIVLLVGDDEGQRVMLLTGGIITKSELKGVVGAKEDVRREDASGPIRPERAGQQENAQDDASGHFHNFSLNPTG